MSALNNTLSSFLLRNLDQLKYRSFLINLLTITSNRPTIVLNKASITAASNGKLEKVALQGSMKPVYLDLKSAILDESDAKKLDALDKWSYTSKLPHIKEKYDLFKHLLEIQNYCCMSQEDKQSIDENSKSIRGCTDREYSAYAIEHYITDKTIRGIFNIICEEDQSTYVAELRCDSNNLTNGEDYIEVCILSDDINSRLMSEIDTLDISGSDMSIVHGKITTTVGRIIVNQLIFVEPFGDMFEFVNAPVRVDDGDMLNDIKQAAIENKITIEAYKKCEDSVYYLGHFTELCTPCLSEHSLTTDANIAKRKAELYKQYAGQLDDPLIISKIEDELIAMDKAWMKDDNAMRFYKPLGDKAFDLWRKKLYIAVGGIEAFDKDTSKYDFIPNSLEEGMTIKDLPKYGNESRKGSYQRGHETRNGGALTKYIIRAFHDSRIQEDDCGSNEGVTVDFTKYTIKKFKGRYIKLNGKWEEITDDNINKIPARAYLMRSPQYCKCNKNGFCFKCMGRTFAEMDIRQLSMNVVDISATFMNAAMKNMHGSKLALNEITSLDHFIL